MHISRIILTAVAILLVVGMYFLPKVVVENEQTDEPTLEAAQESAPVASAHLREVPDSEAELIALFKEEFKKAENPEKSANFADSLAITFADLNFHDSAAYYAVQALQLDSTAARLINAADNHFEAFNYAVELEEKEYWGQLSRKYYQSALDNDAQLYDEKAKMALTYLPTQPMQGVILLREVVEAAPSNRLALYNLGLLSLQSNQFDKAVQRFESLVEAYPDDLEGQFYLGVAYFESGQTADAKSQFQKLQDLDISPEMRSNLEAYMEELK